MALSWCLWQFTKRMAQLGASHIANDIVLLFEKIDADGDGFIWFKELNKKLRKGSAVALAQQLRAGAMGDIEPRPRNALALRGSDGASRTML